MNLLFRVIVVWAASFSFALSPVIFSLSPPHGGFGPFLMVLMVFGMMYTVPALFGLVLIGVVEALIMGVLRGPLKYAALAVGAALCVGCLLFLLTTPLNNDISRAILATSAATLWMLTGISVVRTSLQEV